jgi:hypothetical protein
VLARLPWIALFLGLLAAQASAETVKTPRFMPEAEAFQGLIQRLRDSASGRFEALKGVQRETDGGYGRWTLYAGEGFPLDPFTERWSMTAYEGNTLGVLCFSVVERPSDMTRGRLTMDYAQLREWLLAAKGDWVAKDDVEERRGSWAKTERTCTLRPPGATGERSFLTLSLLASGVELGVRLRFECEGVPAQGNNPEHAERFAQAEAEALQRLLPPTPPGRTRRAREVWPRPCSGCSRPHLPGSPRSSGTWWTTPPTAWRAFGPPRSH